METLFYLADLSRLFFVPLCEGELTGACESCNRVVCKGFWGGDNRTDADSDKEDSPSLEVCQTREDRVLQLAIAYSVKEAMWDNDEDCESPLDTLPAPSFGDTSDPIGESGLDPYSKGLKAALLVVRKVGGRGRPPKLTTTPPDDYTSEEGDAWRGGYCEGLRLNARFPN